LGILASQTGFPSGAALQASVYGAMASIRSAYLETMGELALRDK